MHVVLSMDVGSEETGFARKRSVLVHKPDAPTINVKRRRMKRRLPLAQRKRLCAYWVTQYVTQTDPYTSLLITLLFCVVIYNSDVNAGSSDLHVSTPAEFTDWFCFK